MYRIIISSYHRYDVVLPSVSSPFRLLSKQGRKNIAPFSFFLQQQRNNSNNSSLKDIYGLPFTISPERALEKFEKWARNDQGLNSFIMNWNNVRIAAAYTPVWSFTLNIRFVLINNNDKNKTGSAATRKFDWMPSMFQEAYGTNQSVVHIPGLSAYAGHSYRRSLIEPLHSTTLVFLGEGAVPFGSWMMKDMVLGNNKLVIFPDPLNATRGKAFAIVKENLKQMCLSANNFPSNEYNLKLQTEIISSRRVYMPTYVIDYKVIPNMEFQAFVSGCDEAADVSGVSHKMVRDNNTQDMQQNASSFLNKASYVFDSGSRIGRNLGLGNREFGTIFVIFLQFIGSFAVRILARIPIIGLFVGLLFGFRKVIQPWMDSRSASAEWERQREHEATINVDYKDDFVDSGNAQRYYSANRKRILDQLSGNANHTGGDFDWYQQWEAWARQQWNEQQKQQQQQQQQSPYENTRRQQQQQTQQNQRSTRPRQNSDYKWDFDPNDPYSVLGIKRGATKQEISAAFRREMMSYHPDMQRNASDAEKARAEERSKLISAAYRKLKETQR